MTDSLHRIAALLLVNAHGELLLQLRDDDPALRFPGHWGPIGGSVEADESFEDAVRREAWEEIERTFDSIEYWQTHESTGYETAIFATRLDVPAEAVTLHEGQRVEYFSPQAAMMQPLVPWLMEVLPRFVRSDLYRRLAPDALAVPNEEASSVIFVNREGRLLLRLRDDRPDILYPGHWDLIGGAIEDGESPEDAVVRETLEELGLVLEDFLYWGDMRGIVRIHVFLAPLDLSAESLLLREGQELRWVDPADVASLPLVPYMERLIPQFVSTPPYSELFSSRASQSGLLLPNIGAEEG